MGIQVVEYDGKYTLSYKQRGCAPVKLGYYYEAVVDIKMALLLSSYELRRNKVFLSLLGITFLVSLLVCFVVVRLFTKPIDGILDKIVANDIAYAWTKYLKFAIYVVGISGGVRIHYLENFLQPASEHFTPPVLNSDRWVLEIYRTIIESLQSIAWMLLIFFIFALIAYVIVRAFELRAKTKAKIDDSGRS